MNRAGRQWKKKTVLSLLACLVLAGCAARDSSTDEDRRGGFYGGVFGGRGM